MNLAQSLIQREINKYLNGIETRKSLIKATGDNSSEKRAWQQDIKDYEKVITELKAAKKKL